MARSKLPVTSVSAARKRFPNEWPESSPAAKRCWNSRPISDSSSARATRQLRMSPGGSTPSSRRSRPDEPPSSATVTIAVMSRGRRLRPAQQRREARAAAERRDVGARAHAGSVGAPVERSMCRCVTRTSRALRYRDGEHLGDRDAAVAPAGAADADHHAALALLRVGRQEEVEQRLEAAAELVHPGRRGDEVGDRGVEAGQRVELGDVVRVPEEADVEEEVRVAGHAVLVAERDELHVQARPAPRASSGPRSRAGAGPRSTCRSCRSPGRPGRARRRARPVRARSRPTPCRGPTAGGGGGSRGSG